MPSEIRGRRRQSQAEATAAYASAMALLQGPGGRPASDAMAIQRGVRTDEQRKAALRDGGGLAKYESASWFAMSGQELPVEEDAVANRRTKVRF